MAVLRVKGVSKSFEQEQIIKDISIELREGEIVSLLGVSGGGKTTLFNIIAGLSGPDGGKVYLENEDVTGKPGNVSYMLQKDLLLPYRTIVDNVALPLIIRGMKKKESGQLLRRIWSCRNREEISGSVVWRNETEGSASSYLSIL